MIKAKTSAISSQVHTDLIDWKKMKICLMLPELMRAININEVFRGGRACMSMGERERDRYRNRDRQWSRVVANNNEINFSTK